MWVGVAINYTPLSVAYYAYDSTANFLFLGPTALIYIYACFYRKWPFKFQKLVIIARCARIGNWTNRQTYRVL